MNHHLQKILGIIEQAGDRLSAEQKIAVYKLIEGADKELEITALKLDGTEKAKRTNALLLEKTMRELEQQQKIAEDQNRELEIEAALEKVRARAMAMQKAGELSDLVNTVFVELTKLDYRLDRCLIMIYDAETKDSTWWFSKAEGMSAPIGLHVPYHTHEPYLAYIKAWEEKRSKWEFVLGGEVKKQWDAFVFNETELSLLPAPVQQAMRSFETVYLNVSFNSFGSFTFSSFESLAEKEFDVLLRFAKVFDQTYTRFLDLQKAEAQAREANIEVGLERIRAKTMAMHKSEQLAETAKVFFEQFNLLGNIPDRMSIGIIDEASKKVELWVTDQSGNQVNNEYFFSLDERTSISKIYSAWKESKETIVVDLTGKNLEDWLQFVKEEAKLPIDETKIKGRRVQQAAFFAQGFLLFTTHNPVADEIMKLLMRFASVFEQAYTRFLDLQKAEAQAREAKIEAALERVRARTMAMQKSEELDETNMLIMRQLESLDMSLSGTGIHICYSDKPVSEAWMWDMHAGKMPKVIYNHMHDRLSEKIYEGWKKGETFYVEEVWGERLEEHFEYITTLVPDPTIYEDVNPVFVFHIVYFTYGFFVLVTPDHRPTEHPVFIRFAKVFEQTYTRFLDIQKAEAQAREAQIEAALEKVRSTSLAMHHSTELEQVAGSLFNRLAELGLSFDGALIFIFYKEKRNISLWIATNHLSAPVKIDLPYDKEVENNTILKDLWNAIENGEHIINRSYSGEVKNEYFRYVAKYNESKIPESITELQIEKESWTAHFAAEKNSLIGFDSWSGHPTKEEDFKILIRFAKVFEQAYTRFLDLQKAEAQAREARIEAALERVRSRTMAMHNSQDVTSATETMFDELNKLGIDNLRCGIANIHYNRTFDVFGVTNLADGNTMSGFGLFGMDKHPIWQRWFESWKNKEEVFIAYIAGQEKEEYFNNINNHGKYLPQKIVQFPDSFFQAYYFEQGSVWAYALTQHSESEKEIMKRFATGFSLTFRRYQDLKKAEAQAREASIEAALEKVRSRSLAMHKSSELKDVIVVLFEKLKELGLVFENGGIQLFAEDTKDIVQWVAAPGLAPAPVFANLPYSEKDLEASEVLRDFWMAKEAGKSFYNKNYSFEEKNNFFNYAGRHNNLEQIPVDAREIQMQAPGYTLSLAAEKHCALWTDSYFGRTITEEGFKVLKRTAKVFEQAYIRFLDLQKAETQAREAKIEAALERIRAKALGMQKSGDLMEVATVLRQQMGVLGQPEMESSIIHLYSEDMETLEAWYAYSHPNLSTETITGTAKVSKDSSEWSREVLASYTSTRVEYTIISSGQKIKEWYKVLEEVAPATVEYDEEGQLIIPDILYYHFSKFSGGALLMISNQEPARETRELQKRAAAAFEVAYTRFKDLQQAETQAREAVRQASLDRVRAEIASMRSTSDLQRITPLIWHELNTLGVPFVRCGVFIINEVTGITHTYLSTPEGQPLAVLNLPISEGMLTGKVVEHWREARTYIEHWNKEQFIAWMQSLIDLKQISSKDVYQGEANPPESLDLHFVPFSQGMLYVGNSSPLTNDEIQLLKSLAEAFSIAYARYEDFSQMEEAKNKVDSTLFELKQTQKQLIQSEKMASLGELTAGIAHEIQNPLNFVNNFSEVSRELVDEMEEALKANHADEAMNLANYIKENLQKIFDHGKRADAIVKGMLQHSRASAGKKEPTDINALADEYLRLSYHGLRAKDKSFNADFNTEFDESIAKIEVIPQDIGRVLLNLYNNAFYAVNEKKKTLTLKGENYEPKVWVTTKRLSTSSGPGGLEITVRDNGNGIPQKALDKIFQPFFTTKPTGQGTGLGLSLSYDIIKAHGGELKVETKEGEFTKLMIYLY